jgi:peptidyl-prolyl cis-trans isomerase B (cyclophilin B)
MRKIIILLWIAMLAGGAGSALADEKVQATPAPAGEKAKVTPAPAGEIAVIETRLGNIELEFFEDKAPGHVKNFKTLAKTGFYNGTLFHRVIPGFMIQGGDSNSKNPDRSTHGTGGPGYSIKAEFNDTKHDRGVLSMARSQDPNSAGSQFFIVVKAANFLDGKYTAFGKVIKGMDVADKIVNSSRDPRDNPLESISMKITIQPKK